MTIQVKGVHSASTAMRRAHETSREKKGQTCLPGQLDGNVMQSSWRRGQEDLHLSVERNRLPGKGQGGSGLRRWNTLLREFCVSKRVWKSRRSKRLLNAHLPQQHGDSREYTRDWQSYHLPKTHRADKSQHRLTPSPPMVRGAHRYQVTAPLKARALHTQEALTGTADRGCSGLSLPAGRKQWGTLRPPGVGGAGTTHRNSAFLFLPRTQPPAL